MIEKRREPEKEGNARWARTCATSGTSDENGDPWGSIGHGSPLPTRSKHQLFLRREEKDQAGRYLVEAEQLLEKSRRIERERVRESPKRQMGNGSGRSKGRYYCLDGQDHLWNVCIPALKRLGVSWPRWVTKSGSVGLARGGLNVIGEWERLVYKFFFCFLFLIFFKTHIF